MMMMNVLLINWPVCCGAKTNYSHNFHRLRGFWFHARLDFYLFFSSQTFNGQFISCSAYCCAAVFRCLFILLKTMRNVQKPHQTILWMLSNYTRIFNHFVLCMCFELCVSGGSCLSYLPLSMEQNEFDRKLKMTTNRRIINSHLL